MRNLDVHSAEQFCHYAKLHAELAQFNRNNIGKSNGDLSSQFTWYAALPRAPQQQSQAQSIRTGSHDHCVDAGGFGNKIYQERHKDRKMVVVRSGVVVGE